MERIDHRPFTIERENADTAVLLLHGIVSTPAHFRHLLSQIPETISLYALLLDGHGGSVEDFSHTSMKKWKVQVAQQLEFLCQKYRCIYIVAHSMGTLFAINAAVSHPEKVKGLFLLAAPLRPQLPFRTFRTCLQAARGKTNPQVTLLRNDVSVCMQGPLYRYLGWIPRFLEFFALVRQTRKVLPQLTTPTKAFQSHTDELVRLRAANDLKTNPIIQTTILYGSGHFAYSEEDTALLRRELKNLLI